MQSCLHVAQTQQKFWCKWAGNPWAPLILRSFHTQRWPFPLFTMRNILKMDVSFNALLVLPAHCFQYQTKVKVLTLNHNLLGHINEKSFVGLVSLNFLNLSSNQLETFSSIFAQESLNLSVLYFL